MAQISTTRGASNFVVPLNNALKRTKELDLTVTSQDGGNAFTKVAAKGMAYADSTGIWRLRFNIVGDFANTVSTSPSIAITGVIFKNLANFYQAITVMVGTTAPYTASGSVTPNTAYVGGFSTATATNWRFSGDVELNAEPAWAAANMEGLADVAVYVEPASATGAGTLNHYGEFSGSTAACTGALTGNASWGGVRIGKNITLRLNPISGSTNNTQTQFSYGTAIPTANRPGANMAIPCLVKNNGVYVTGLCYVAASTGVITIYAGANFTDKFDGNSGLDYDVHISYSIV